jgi:Outer membrane protein beta-barrel domain
MKKKFFSLLIPALIIGSISFAQGLHIGVKGGANIVKVDGKQFSDEYQYGYNLGAFAEIGLNDKWAIQPEVMWNQTNYKTGDEFKDLYSGGVNNFKGKLSYLSIPLLLNFKPSKLLTLQAGPQFGILINQDEGLFTNGQEAFKSGDFSMLGGVQLNFGGAKVGGRYVIGLTNLNDIDNTEKWKNQGFQLYVGFRII